jgi:hypothetical protein
MSARYSRYASVCSITLATVSMLSRAGAEPPNICHAHRSCVTCSLCKEAALQAAARPRPRMMRCDPWNDSATISCPLTRAFVGRPS